MADDLDAINRDIARLGRELIDQRLRSLQRAHGKGEPLALLELVATAHQHGRPIPKAAQHALGQAATRYLTERDVDLAELLGAVTPGRGKTNPRMARAERLRDAALADAMAHLRGKLDPVTGAPFTIGRAADLVARAAPANFEWLPGVKPAPLAARTIRDRAAAWEEQPRVRTKEGRTIYLRALELARTRSRVKTRS